MNFSCSNDKVLALAEQHKNTSTLYYFSNYSEGCKQEFDGRIAGIKLDGDDLLCIVEHTSEDQSYRKVDLHTFDTTLNIISSETVFEIGPPHTDAVSGIKSAMDDNYIYVVMFGTATLGAEDNRFEPFDMVCQLAFVRIDVATKEVNEWDLADSLGDTDCIDGVWSLINGYIRSFDSLGIYNGDLMLDCTAYDPDMKVEFGGGIKKDMNLRSFKQTIQVYFDEKKLINSSIQLQETWDKTPFSWLRFNEEVYSIAVLDGKVYVASSKGFYCIDGHATNIILTCPWPCSVDDPQRYRDFHIWNDKLVFEIRDNEKLTGFLTCPACFEEPDNQDWVEVVFQEG